MRIYAVLRNRDTGRSVEGYLTTDSAASSYGLAVFEHALPDEQGVMGGQTVNRGDLTGNWELEVAPENRALVLGQPAWRGILAQEAP